ncbi:CCA tRNA nucleotidyltransferase [Engelhardtia mirabilis]|uniref:tRNA nucleotidyltransferase/poly(A) polymerase n=1 Tax=Engelhardtia mirabilis TaxID=2528011 RepID=A0A518BKR1_9BACT|nr:tRNA nucleotidyltransferase/poly(A) polymerase [Planctomycetes bacterium Pla133]QDV01887.1 tRNA nucleotidyltransferase/poly(A) polymerase [Planctomycetes bacterium Pla86]
MRTPAIEDVPQALRERAIEVAGVLRTAGHRAWIVGGAVRDLALGYAPKDLDMASGATPEEIEVLFPSAVGVGRAFGTMILPSADGDVELTTFRGEGDYADGRRPERVHYGVSLEEDAARRDFTANALYLDPLDGTLADPEGGLADLERGLLRTVGDPRARFEEDALRLLRLGRFAGRYGLTVPQDVLEAASAAAPGLARVSGERVASELGRIGAWPGTLAAVAILARVGALVARFDSWGDEALAGTRRALIEALGDGAGTTVFMAALFWNSGGGQASDELDSLRLSRADRREIGALWQLGQALSDAGRRRSSLLRALRELDEPLALRWAGALAEVCPATHGAGRSELARAATEVPAADRRPAPLLRSDDLRAAGVPRGPAWGELLSEHEDLQLEGQHTDRGLALDWLARRAAELGEADQLGGKSRRS